jgi:hypothetical protein
MQERELFFSSEDKKTYRKWRMGVLVLYVSAVVLAITSVTALRFVGRAVQCAAQ